MSDSLLGVAPHLECPFTGEQEEGEHGQAMDSGRIDGDGARVSARLRHYRGSGVGCVYHSARPANGRAISYALLYSIHKEGSQLFGFPARLPKLIHATSLFVPTFYGPV